MTVTGLSIVTAIFETLQVFQPGESIPAADAESVRQIVNRMLGLWAQRSLLIPSIAREVFPLVSGKGGPSNPYTIGTGANLSTARPPNQASVVGAGLLLNATTPAVEIARTVATDDMYQRIAVKELANSLFTYVYYNPTFATGGFGTIQLWPVPNAAVNSLVLYLQKPLVAFADLTTSYELQDGYDDAIVTNGARKAAKPFGVPVDADLVNDANLSLRVLTRVNLHMSDLSNDFARDQRGDYNILTGDGG